MKVLVRFMLLVDIKESGQKRQKINELFFFPAIHADHLRNLKIAASRKISQAATLVSNSRKLQDVGEWQETPLLELLLG